MIRLRKTNELSYDATAIYDVILGREHTAESFLNLASIDGFFGYIKFYCNGELLAAFRYKNEFYRGRSKTGSSVMDRTVVSAKANGGFGRMDYNVELKQK